MNDQRVSRSVRFDPVSLDGGHVLYDGVELRFLPGPAALVWSHVDGVSTAAVVAERIGSLFPGDPVAVHQEVLGFIVYLAHRGVLDVVAPPPEVGYVRPMGIGYVREGGIGLLVDMEDGRRRSLTASGARAWELVCELRYRSLVVAALQAEWPAAPTTMPSEVHVLLDDLVASRFLIRHERSS